MPINPTETPPCPSCGGALAVGHYPDEEPPGWSATCEACGWEWVDLDEPPTWALLGQRDHAVGALLAQLAAPATGHRWTVTYDTYTGAGRTLADAVAALLNDAIDRAPGPKPVDSIAVDVDRLCALDSALVLERADAMEDDDGC